MEKIKTSLLIAGFLILTSGITGKAQNRIWTLEDCINYALTNNITVQKADLLNNKNELYSKQAKANRLPSLNASANQNFNWYKGFDSTTGEYGSSKGANSTSYSVNSNVSLFNGNKLTNQIKSAKLDLESGHFYSEEVKESIGLNILNAYLQVLYAKESVSNAQKQIESTTEQLDLAKERVDLGVISMLDYLQIKSELATEKLTLANAKSELYMSKVSLMQLMEFSVDISFEISSPDLNSMLLDSGQPEVQEIYSLALGIKPQIKYAELSKESAMLGIKIAKADALPSLSMNAGLSSAYSSLTAGSGYFSQLNDKINPSVGFSLSIPIFQKKQIKTNVAVASISVFEAELDLVNTKNELRKSIEQACADVVVAQSRYIASLEQNKSTQESYDVTNEKYKLGLLNSVDFLVQKTNLITSESELLQSKFNVIFSYKLLDFYKGIPLTL
ncbi:TolC family protein [Labilibaculum sp.]|uniref:TolC family protein n=1 Tax=Labilibaculum sp. TaxID=2060723 RepID=UPI002AA7900F|nr:TolC family protein [Labilibaculum sp.]